MCSESCVQINYLLEVGTLFLINIMRFRIFIRAKENPNFSLSKISIITFLVARVETGSEIVIVAGGRSLIVLFLVLRTDRPCSTHRRSVPLSSSSSRFW